MDILVKILIENLGGIPKLIDACSFYMTCAGIKEIAKTVVFFIFISMGFRLLSKFLEIVKDELSR